MSGAWLSILLLVVLVVLDLAFVSWRYALDDRAQKLEIPTPDGFTVVAWYRPAVTRRCPIPVVLCHGLANNHAFMEFRGSQNLAKFLSEAGFDCYSVDLRGAGAARTPDEGVWDATIDDHIRLDVPAIIDAVCRRAGSEKVAWVGHSLGGVVALGAASTIAKERFAAIVTVGTPVFFRFPSQLRWLMRLASWVSVWGQFNTHVLRLIAPFAGRTRAPAMIAATANMKNLEPRSQRFLVANVFAPMWRGVLRQLEDWLTHDVFRSLDGTVDYRAGLSTLTMPMLVIGGTADQLAPPSVVRQLFATLQAPVRELVIFGQEHGHRAEYGHGDLIVGQFAHEEIYPVIARFLAANVAVDAPGK
jgi:pimeloyl-ACP methyl ester carboxylesterase